MKIGILSDTHIPKITDRLPKIIYKEFKNIDLILHAGDLVEMSVLDELSGIARTEAVAGNMDSWNVQDRLPKKKIVKALGFKIGLIHGYGRSDKLIETVGREFTDVDVIIFGHSHSPVNKVVGGVLYFNPGSPTDKVFASSNSYGILEIDKTVKGKIIKIK